MAAGHRVALHAGDALAAYGFGEGHPFGPDRYHVFWSAVQAQGIDAQVNIVIPVTCARELIEYFHTVSYVDQVIEQSKFGVGYLDGGDTPAFPGIYEAGATVVGTTVDAVRRIMNGQAQRAFTPIAGLHHARRDSAAGFCVFNDCGVAIETLRAEFGVRRIAYVDIDAHHGDGVFYAFEDDPDLCFADVHEDGRFLYPGTGAITATGRGAAVGSKLNVPMPMEADDAAFMRVWPAIEDFVAAARPEFILFQCGADSLAGDPITHLRFSEQAHAHAAARLCALAGRLCDGRLLAMGGGGYNRDNLARAWTAVLRAMVDAE